MSASAKPAEITVCYNGACPVCDAEMARYRRIASAHALPMGWHDINTASDLFQAHGIDFDTAMRRLHAVDDQGRLLRSVDVFVAIWRRLPGWRWLADIVAFPLVRPIAWFVYEYLIAYPVYRRSRHRYRTRLERQARAAR